MSKFSFHDRPVVLVTGGAGYIGSHTCLRLAECGFTPLVYDDLSAGHEEAIRWGPFERGDVRDTGRLAAVLAAWTPVGAIHFAALIDVAGSQTRTAAFYDVNVAGVISVLSALTAAGIAPFVFSSTCATYGNPIAVPIDETHPQAPINPYGRTKFVAEQTIADFAGYAGLSPVMLRYFNAAGADPEGRIGERHDPETHAIPLAVQAAQGLRPGFSIFGTDYDTPDGTAVRDYIHVLDLAEAHVLALRRAIAKHDPVAINLGTGRGTSVRSLVDTVARVSGRTFEVTSIRGAPETRRC